MEECLFRAIPIAGSVLLYRRFFKKDAVPAWSEDPHTLPPPPPSSPVLFDAPSSYQTLPLHMFSLRCFIEMCGRSPGGGG